MVSGIEQLTYYEFFISCKGDEDGAFPVVFDYEEGSHKQYLRKTQIINVDDVALALKTHIAYVPVERDADCYTDKDYLEQRKKRSLRNLSFPEKFRRCYFVAVSP